MADSDLKFPEAASRVVDEFTPKCSLHLSWDNGNKVVAEGDQVTPTQAQDLPTLRFDGDKDKLYTIIISDPDAPSVADPKFGEWQHMIVVNAPSSDFASGEAITAYFGSAPGKDSGMHRYCVVVYEQPDKIVPDEEKISATRYVQPLCSIGSQLIMSSPIAGVHAGSWLGLTHVHSSLQRFHVPLAAASHLDAPSRAAPSLPSTTLFLLRC